MDNDWEAPRRPRVAPRSVQRQQRSGEILNGQLTANKHKLRPILRSVLTSAAYFCGTFDFAGGRKAGSEVPSPEFMVDVYEFFVTLGSGGK